jgi:surface antigen
MRSDYSIFPLLAAGSTAFALVAAIFVSADFAQARDPMVAATPSPGCSCPDSAGKSSTKPKFAGIQAPLDASDEMAVLESVQLALTQVADGSSYVWHRSHGRLSGIVRPTASFKDHRGHVCRHILVVLSASAETKKTEAIACRLETGGWELDG